MSRDDPLRSAIDALTLVVDESGADESLIIGPGRAIVAELVSRDDWLPEAFAQPHPEYYRQYLMYCDPRQRFSIVSFVWGPGQKTPVHDHTVWALIGMLRGAERSERYVPGATGEPMRAGGMALLQPGEVDAVSPALGDIHQVSNAFDDRVSISVHVYGGNIGTIKRHVYDPLTGVMREFVSGYANS